VRNYNKRNAAAAATCLVISGCGAEVVGNPIAPQDARAEVIGAARDITTILHADVTEARFRYESCNDQGDPPFKGVVRMSFWILGHPHNQPVDSQEVIKPLEAQGWSADSDFVSHSPTLRKNNINIILTVVPAPRPGKQLVSHVAVEVDGECRDTFDHRTDRSILPIDVRAEVQPG
jgi:hypothetical protein